jgi:hypothetical protein
VRYLCVELYTGGLWSDSQLEVHTVDTQLLTAELFAVGFRWSHRPRSGLPVLWHRELEIGIDLIEARASSRAAEQSNVLLVGLDLSPERASDGEMVWLKIVGIEDLIAEQARYYLMDGVPPDDCVTRLQALVGLGQEGVSGGLRAGYLERRLASETGGEVALDLSSPERCGTRFSVPRMATLTRMQVIIDAWHDRQGLSFDRQGSSGQSDSLDDRDPIGRRRNDRQERAGQSCLETDNVMPFCAELPMSLHWR